MIKNLLIIGGTAASGGIPEDIQRGIVQVVTALILWGLTRLFDKFKPKAK